MDEGSKEGRKEGRKGLLNEGMKEGMKEEGMLPKTGKPAFFVRN